MKRKDEIRTAATVTIHGAPTMTTREAKAIATWLKRLGADIVRNADSYSKRFTARYFMPPKK